MLVPYLELGLSLLGFTCFSEIEPLMTAYENCGLWETLCALLEGTLLEEILDLVLLWKEAKTRKAQCDVKSFAAQVQEDVAELRV